MFNMWSPFAVKLLPDDEGEADIIARTKDLALILQRTGVLCNHKRKTFDFVVNWEAQLFQYPNFKSVMLCFLSKEGCGKGTFLKLLFRMIGQHAVLETTDPKTHVWTRFNDHLAVKFLVVVNEVDDFDGAQGRIKGLITDDKLWVEVKNGKKTEINSFHRFILTAQVKEGAKIPTYDGTRRYYIVRASDELCTGHADTHAAFIAVSERTSAQRDFYRFLMQRPCPKSIGKDEIEAAMTDHHHQLNAANRDPVEQFLASLVHDEGNADGKLMLTPAHLFERYHDFCVGSGMRCTLTKKALAFQISSKKLSFAPGSFNLWDVALKKMVRTWTIDLVKLRQMYGSGDDGETMGEEEDGVQDLTWDDYLAMAKAHFELEQESAPISSHSIPRHPTPSHAIPILPHPPPFYAHLHPTSPQFTSPHLHLPTRPRRCPTLSVKSGKMTTKTMSLTTRTMRLATRARVPMTNARALITAPTQTTRIDPDDPQMWARRVLCNVTPSELVCSCSAPATGMCGRRPATAQHPRVRA